MAQNQSNELCVDFAENAFWFRSSPFVQLSIFLPKFEDQFYLPATARQYEYLVHLKYRWWDTCQEDGPILQIRRAFRCASPFLLIVIVQFAATLGCDAWGNSACYQATR